MKNKILLSLGTVAALGSSILPVFAHADTSGMWGVASSSAAVTQFFTDLGTLLTQSTTNVLLGLAGLLGLGFAIHKIRKYVTGRKF